MLIFAFLLALLALILQGIIIPHIALLPFAPFLALLILRCRLQSALWLSALAGAIMDLLSDDPMGLHALNYLIAASLLFRYRSHFSADRPLHLVLLTFLISALSTSIQLILLFLFDRRVPFDGRWVITELVGMPAIDALYAFAWFAAPLALADKLRRMWVLFWLKRQNSSPLPP